MNVFALDEKLASIDLKSTNLDVYKLGWGGHWKFQVLQPCTIRF